jgi:hypothetical protein
MLRTLVRYYHFPARQFERSVFTRVHSYSPTPPAPPVGLFGLTWAVLLRKSKPKRALIPPGAVHMTESADDGKFIKSRLERWFGGLIHQSHPSCSRWISLDYPTKLPPSSSSSRVYKQQPVRPARLPRTPIHANSPAS